MSCGVGRRRGLDPTFLWLLYRPAATGSIRPLAREPPHAEGAALEKAKKKKISLRRVFDEEMLMIYKNNKQN